MLRGVWFLIKNPLLFPHLLEKLRKFFFGLSSQASWHWGANPPTPTPLHPNCLVQHLLQFEQVVANLLFFCIHLEPPPFYACFKRSVRKAAVVQKPCMWYKRRWDGSSRFADADRKKGRERENTIDHTLRQQVREEGCISLALQSQFSSSEAIYSLNLLSLPGAPPPTFPPLQFSLERGKNLLLFSLEEKKKITVDASQLCHPMQSYSRLFSTVWIWITLHRIALLGHKHP